MGRETWNWMTKEEYIEEHIKHCNASRCKKYDNKKLKYSWLHTLAYSKRKCAKASRNSHLRYLRKQDEKSKS